MYMITRDYAKWVMENINNSLTPFSPDWTITKNGKRALIYPMLAIENGEGLYPDYGQHIFHLESHTFNYTPEFK